MAKQIRLTLQFRHPFNKSTITVKIDPTLTPKDLVKELIASNFLEEEFSYELAVQGKRKILPWKESFQNSGVEDGAKIRVTAFEENA